VVRLVGAVSVSLAGACGFDWTLPTGVPVGGRDGGAASGEAGAPQGSGGATGGAGAPSGGTGAAGASGAAGGADVGPGGSGGSEPTCESCAHAQIQGSECGQIAASWGLTSGEIDLVESAVDTPELLYLWPECGGQDELLGCGVCRRCAPICTAFDSFCSFIEETCAF
jgi:hypothetical protein